MFLIVIGRKYLDQPFGYNKLANSSQQDFSYQTVILILNLNMLREEPLQKKLLFKRWQ